VLRHRYPNATPLLGMLDFFHLGLTRAQLGFNARCRLEHALPLL
jgi:hypothetical protein